MFPGDSIICTDNLVVHGVLTIGKEYKIEEPCWLSDSVIVTNDLGVRAAYIKRRFKMSQSNFIKIEGNTVVFTLQDGPIKENGVNGCQIDDVIRFARDRIQTFQSALPCRENDKALEKLDETLMWLDLRTKNRMLRNVEGTSAI